MNEKQRVVRWSDLVTVQEGSVVSRTVLKNASGTITFFAMDCGETISEHKNPYGAMIFVLEGELELTLSGFLHRLEAGECIVMKPYEPHALEAKKPLRFLLVMIKSDEERNDS